MEQTGWSNFNEGCDLEAAVEDYFRKFGCYPSAVLADRIYQTRRNKMFCAQLGIRLSGPPLGRRKASEADTKIKRQIYRDACERNAIEGRNGNAKRRFGLDRLFSKRDKTAKTEAALIILAMNASLRLVRWLALFFRSLLSLFLYGVFQQALVRLLCITAKSQDMISAAYFRLCHKDPLHTPLFLSENQAAYRNEY